MEHWTRQIDHTTDAFLNNFGSLTAEELNRKPNPDTWSIAQNMEHLIVTNETFFPALEELKAGTHKLPFIARFGFIVNLLGKTILDSVKPDKRQKKVKTFSVWEPTAEHLSENIIERFKHHQEELKQQIASSEELVKQGAIIASPANKYIVYKLETAFNIVVNHEQRHLEQAKEVLELLEKVNQSNLEEYN